MLLSRSYRFGGVLSPCCRFDFARTRQEMYRSCHDEIGCLDDICDFVGCLIFASDAFCSFLYIYGDEVVTEELPKFRLIVLDFDFYSILNMGQSHKSSP